MPQAEENTSERLVSLVPLKDEFLTTDDVLLSPGLGKLKSRQDAILNKYIYSSPMDTVTGLELTRAMIENNHFAVVCRFTKDQWFETLQEFGSNPDVFFAVGSKKTDAEGLLAGLMLTDPEAKVSINIDVAHGDTEYIHELYKWYSEQEFVGNIMSGSICTPDAAIRAVDSGCTHLRVGVGPGSACTTRIKTGCGLPQLTAVFYIDAALRLHGMRNRVQIIADGGVRQPGDAVKYIAAGADAVMLGNRLSQTIESQGWFDHKEHWWSKTRKAKRFRGQASRQFQQEMLGKNPSCAEGASGELIYPTQSAKEVIQEFEGGMRSALSYLGLISMDELNSNNVTFIKVTPSAYTEGTPHGIK